jgi:hypothetical protein
LKSGKSRGNPEAKRLLIKCHLADEIFKIVSLDVIIPPIEAHSQHHPLKLIGIIMKKTFKIAHPKIKAPRMFEAIKYEVKKYIKRERRKTLPEDVDFWDFDCRYGADEASSETIHLSAINKSISQAESDQLESFYLEILVKPGHRTKKPIEEQPVSIEDSEVQNEDNAE